MTIDHEFAHSSGQGQRKFILPTEQYTLTPLEQRPVRVRCGYCDWTVMTNEARMADLQRAHFIQHHSTGGAF